MERKETNNKLIIDFYCRKKNLRTKIPEREAKKIDESGFSALPKKFHFINSARVEKLVKKISNE